MAGGARDGGGEEDAKTTTNEGRGGGSDHAAARATTNSNKQLVPFLGMFRYADRTDATLMAVGTVAAVANGMTEPLMTVVFAAIIECFGAGDDATILHRVSKVRCYYVPTCVYVYRFNRFLLGTYICLFHASARRTS